MPYEDMLLRCVKCNLDFDFPATEQDYFSRMNLLPPKRCRKCREIKKTENISKIQNKSISFITDQAKINADLLKNEINKLSDELKSLKSKIESTESNLQKILQSTDR